ncbi:MAG: hypothetical protein IJ088_14855, partial [Clostridia bacterium]|nr:hypothetical protein [Clostridia bacterium]
HATGLYHYHHGYEAHQHPGGICPFTNEVWELAAPERPATLAEWEAQKHAADELAAIDDQTPENDDWKKARKSVANAKSGSSSAIPVATVAGGAALLGGAFAAARAKRKKEEEKVAESTGERPESLAKAPAPKQESPAKPLAETPKAEKDVPPYVPPADKSPEAVIPEGTVIGHDGLPWEREAYEREHQKPPIQPGSSQVATNFAEPKWGRLYSFCVDADGEEIHTLDCKDAFIQVNVADPTCPKLDCPVCKPVRPDLRWFEEYKKRKATWKEEEKKTGEAG